MIFKNCICIAQARIIEGPRKKAHICTIAYHEDLDSFLRICLPFEYGKDTKIRRWSRFCFEGQKPEKDTRVESYEFGKLLSIDKQLSANEKILLHQKILSLYQHESELNENKKSIGIIVPEPSSLEFQTKPLTEREVEYKNIMKSKGIFFPDFTVRVIGKSGQFKRKFNKQLVQWDVFEAIRKDIDPFLSLKSYKEPYIITGNTPWKRDSFLAISILSAPKSLTVHAHHQQLSLI